MKQTNKKFKTVILVLFKLNTSEAALNNLLHPNLTILKSSDKAVALQITNSFNDKMKMSSQMVNLLSSLKRLIFKPLKKSIRKKSKK
jgi:hypothetical protein